MGKNDQSSNYSKLATPAMFWIVYLVIIIVVVATGIIFNLNVAGIVATLLVVLLPIVDRLTSRWEQIPFLITEIWPVVFLILSFSGCQLLLNSLINIDALDPHNWFSVIAIDNEELQELSPKDIVEIIAFVLLSGVSYFVVAYVGASTFVNLRYPSAIIAVSLNFIVLLASPLKLMIPMNAPLANFLDSWGNLFKPSVFLIVAIVWVFFILAAVGGISLGKHPHRQV